MNINEFVRERKGEWDRLESISAGLRPGASRRLTRDELWELGRLYNAAVSDLAILKSSGLASDPHNEVITYLNGLVIRVHQMIYRRPPFDWSHMVRFLIADFPSAVREAYVYVLAAAAAFFLFVGVGLVLGSQEPGFIELVVPERIIEQVGALCLNHHLSVQFWSFVLPHGSLELTAVVIAGGAGFVIGHALIDPGPHKRVDYLSVRGPLAAKLTIGCVPLLVTAGIIEAFFSPSPLPAWLKFLFAAVLFALVLVFLCLSGPKKAPTDLRSSPGQRAFGSEARANFSGSGFSTG
ncbi:MAG: stage II sporulation protein M [Deltaproteobacteria bacterium]